MKEKLFFMDITTSFENEGDVLINRSLIENLCKYGEVHINVRKKPLNFIEKITVNIDGVILEENFYFKLFRYIITKKVYIITTPGHSFGTGFKKCFSNIFSFCFLFLLKIFGAKICKFGASAGPYDLSVNLTERLRSKLFNFYGLRDKKSIKLLKLNPDKSFFPDLSFISEDISKLKNRKSKNSIQNIVISFRPETNVLEKRDDYIDSLNLKLQKILENTSKKIVIIFCYQVPSDKEINFQLYKSALSLGLNVIWMQDKLTLQQALEIYNNSYIVISNRLHILLPSLILNVRHIPMIDTKSHAKITAIYEDLGLKEMLCDIYSDEKVDLSLLINDFSDKTISAKIFAKKIFDEVLQ